MHNTHVNVDMHLHMLHCLNQLMFQDMANMFQLCKAYTCYEIFTPHSMVKGNLVYLSFDLKAAECFVEGSSSQLIIVDLGRAYSSP